MTEEKRLTVRLPKDLHDKFKAATAGNGKDMTEVVLDFVAGYVSIHALFTVAGDDLPLTHEQYEQALRILQSTLEEEAAEQDYE